MSDWYVYMVRCVDNSLYTGITSDLLRRVEEHNSGRLAASYTRSRRPVELVYFERQPARGEALKREHQIRQLDKLQKEALIIESSDQQDSR